MSQASAGRELDDRVLVLAPTSRDAGIVNSILTGSAIPTLICGGLDELLAELDKGAAAVLIPEEIVAVAVERLSAALATQPKWSDLPILVLTRPGANSAESGDAVRTLGNVTLLERPLQITTFLSAVRTAIRARERQYQIRGHLQERARNEDALRLADQRKDEFLATLGHELRNPLSPLLTGLQLLKSSGIDDPTLNHVVPIMERQVSHLVTLVNDLLEVSRITRGIIVLHKTPLDLAGVIESAIDTSRPLLEAAKHRLTVHWPAVPISISGDSVRLTQVFSNLLTNAAKYTNSGGEIIVSVRLDGNVATVSVRDNGIGIPPAHLSSVFDMFMQVDRSNRRAQGGLGIGLTLVRSLVEMHGGRVEARSAGPGTGSEFIVELPARAEQARPAVPLDIPTSMPNCRILIVDDNRDASETLATLLQTLGATTGVAHSGREALEALDRFSPDVVLLDIGMPEMDGYEVARRIHVIRPKGLLLIALTGWGQDHDQRLSKAAGFDHHLVKPPDLRKLRSILVNR